MKRESRYSGTRGCFSQGVEPAMWADEVSASVGSMSQNSGIAWSGRSMAFLFIASLALRVSIDSTDVSLPVQPRK